MARRTTGTARASVIGLAVLACLATTTASLAGNVRAGFQSPLRAGARPGCRWVQVSAQQTRICDSRGQCRTQTTPSQRIWACGTVRK